MDNIAVSLALVLVFVLIGGYFAASELALVSLRDGQVRSLRDRSRRGARVARLHDDQNRFLSAVQIGVTFSGFFASSYGGSTIAVRIQPALTGLGVPKDVAATASLVLVTLLVSYFSLVLGELVPKRLALQKPEGIALAVAPTLDRVASLTRPVIWLLSASTNAVVRIMGLDPKADGDRVSEEELRDLVSEHEDLGNEERKVLSDVFQADDRVLAEVMIPRTGVHFLNGDLTLDEAVRKVTDQPHSRYPVTSGSVDDVIGFVHVRDLFTTLWRDGDNAGLPLRDLVREVPMLPGSNAVLPTLAELRRGRGHLAVVVDEYGGTDGIVTIEDLIEEVVGEIEDEYDPEREPARTAPEGGLELDGMLHRDDVRRIAGVELPDGHFDTLAGFLLSRFDREPDVGEAVEALGTRFTVTAKAGRRISGVRAEPGQAPEDGDDAEGAADPAA